MVEMKNPIKEADANPEINHLSLWRTDLAYFWVINCDAQIAGRHALSRER